MECEMGIICMYGTFYPAASRIKCVVEPPSSGSSGCVKANLKSNI